MIPSASLRAELPFSPETPGAKVPGSSTAGRTDETVLARMAVRTAAGITTTLAPCSSASPVSARRLHHAGSADAEQQVALAGRGESLAQRRLGQRLAEPDHARPDLSAAGRV